MLQRFQWLYPFLLALLPVLHMTATHPNQASMDDLGLIVILILAGCALVYVAAVLVSRQPRRAAPLVSMLVVLWFYGYGKVANNLNEWAGASLHLVIVPLGLLATAGASMWLWRHPGQLDRLAQVLTLTGVLLVAQFGARIGVARWRLGQEIRRSELIRRLQEPIAAGDHSRGEPRRDVYLIVLDEYANSTVTRERFGFDNHDFENSLRRLGFVIPAVVRSNYMHTMLSLPSLLNMAHLTELGSEIGPSSADPAVPNYLVENNRASAFLQKQGYRFLFFPSQWWLSTRHNRHADLEFHAWTGLSSRELSHTELRRNVRRITVLDELQSDVGDDFDFTTRTFEALSRVPRQAGSSPTFVFAHIMKPHHPFVFDEQCRPRRRHVLQHAHNRAPRRGYAMQLQCLNQMVLDLVDTLIRASAVPPIIILQGDHGTKTLGASTAPSPSAISPAAARERFGAFGAYYLPGGGSAQLGDTVTVVNVLGSVLRHYFGADLPRQPDDLYMSVTGRPYAFKRVGHAWLGAGQAASPALANPQ